jgi:hypothetical protein
VDYFRVARNPVLIGNWQEKPHVLCADSTAIWISRYQEYLSAASKSHTYGFHHSISATVAKQPFAALLKRSASALSLALQYELEGLNAGDQLLKLRMFSLRQLFPTFWGWGAVAKAKEQLPDLVEGETDLTRSLECHQPVERGLVVSSLAASG